MLRPFAFVRMGCVSVCNAEVLRSCTTITDCTSYCDAIEGIANAGGCVTQTNAYIACAKTAGVCEVKTSCGSQNSDFSSCEANYCDANTTDSDCVVLSDTL